MRTDWWRTNRNGRHAGPSDDRLAPVVSADLRTTRQLDRWMDRSLAFLATLPDKPPRRRSATGYNKRPDGCPENYGSRMTTEVCA